MGEARLTTADDGTDPNNALDDFWDGGEMETLIDMGPEEGWSFARRTYHGIDDDSTAITSIANSAVSGDITVTANAHGLIVGDMVELAGDTGYDGTYDVNVITTNTFDVTATFVATGTGTAHWRSEEFSYRYAVPSTANRVTAVRVGSIELTDWLQKGEYILTNQESDEVDMDYILKFSSLTVTNLPPHFVGLIWRYLRVLLAYNFIQNKALGDGWMEELERIHLRRAIGMDNRRKFVQEESTAWADAGRTATVIE
jgi:hypothetical protein